VLNFLSFGNKMLTRESLAVFVVVHVRRNFPFGGFLRFEPFLDGEDGGGGS
jgi:hypothetical protein